MTPEQKARQNIDRLLELAGWSVQDPKAANIIGSRGVAIREFPLKQGHGFADYLLYVDGRAAGVIEAKKEGVPLVAVELQTVKYTTGLPDTLPAWCRPLPFSYESTRIETRFTNGLDPDPRSRPVFAFHRPETLAKWLEDASAKSEDWPEGEDAYFKVADAEAPYIVRGRTFLDRIQEMPPLVEEGPWPAQVTAIKNLERCWNISMRI